MELVGNGRQTHQIEAILDTGFQGDLSLPSEIIRRLRLASAGELDVRLANGQEITLPSYEGRVLWHGRPRSIIVLESGDEALLGMNLLWRSRVTLDVRANGDVVIEELG